jgi:hypothetical protein
VLLPFIITLRKSTNEHFKTVFFFSSLTLVSSDFYSSVLLKIEKLLIVNTFEKDSIGLVS